jgi:hypothetical protein
MEKTIKKRNRNQLDKSLILDPTLKREKKRRNLEGPSTDRVEKVCDRLKLFCYWFNLR